MAARSFFSYHYSTLQYRTAERRKLRERSRKVQDYQFTREDLKKMCDVGDLTEQYVVTAGKSFGLRAGDFLRLTRGDLEPYLNREVPIAIGEISTEKESVKAFPFVDSDAAPVIKLMVERMDREGRTGPDDRILDYKKERQLSRILQRLVKKAGIVTGNKQVRFHCLRKYLADRLSSVMSESKWKQILGKMIDEKAYVSPDSLRADYTRAMTETCFQKEVEERAIDAAKAELAKRLTPELKELMGKAGYKMRRPKYIGRTRSKAVEKAENCKDGSHCPEFRQVSEVELLDMLKNGWEIVKELSNGEVIVKRVQ
jgi:hypothetical protein